MNVTAVTSKKVMSVLVVGPIVKNVQTKLLVPNAIYLMFYKMRNVKQLVVKDSETKMEFVLRFQRFQ